MLCKEQAPASFGLPCSFQVLVYLFPQLSVHGLGNTLCHSKLQFSWKKQSVSTLSIWCCAFLMPYYSFFYVLHDFPTCAVNQSMEQIWVRNLITNYYQGTFPCIGLPVEQWKGQPGSGNRGPNMAVSVIVLTYSGLKYHVSHPKNFLHQHTFRGPQGRHNLLFIPVCSANVERRTFFLLPLPTQALL